MTTTEQIEAQRLAVFDGKIDEENLIWPADLSALFQERDELKAEVERVKSERLLTAQSALDKADIEINRLRSEKEQAEKVVEILRGQLSDPPIDVQEMVIKKLDLIHRGKVKALEEASGKLQRHLMCHNKYVPDEVWLPFNKALSAFDDGGGV